jgi:ABC-type multidrug transport system fused ATPase/permease subunit
MTETIIRVWELLTVTQKKKVVMLLLLMLASAFLEVISIGAVLPFLGILTAPETFFKQEFYLRLINEFGLVKPEDQLLLITIIFVTAAVMSAATRLLLLWLQNRISYEIGTDWSTKIYERALYQPYEVHLSVNSSELIAAISGKVSQVIYQGLIPFLSLCSSALMLLAITTALIAIYPMIALVAFGGFGLMYLIIMLLTKRRVASNSLVISKNSDRVVKSLQDGLGGIRDILIDGTQKTYSEIYRAADRSLRLAQANNSVLSGSPRFLLEAFGISLIASMAYFMSGREAGFSQAIPTLGALALGAQRVLPAMQQIYQGWANVSGCQASLDNLLELISRPLPKYVEEPKMEPLIFERSIVFKNVAFSYSGQRSPVLRSINLEIRKGSRVGIIGSTGAGKSTLLDNFMGLLLPTSGVIEIDGIAITSKNFRAWQSHISHVPQTVFLTDASIAENIAFGLSWEELDIDRVRIAAKQAQLAETIESWEMQYQTPVGERGIRLSGGQRQRIGIARALYKQTHVIVFDEATSALDSETEMAVMNAINGIGGGVTVLIVAHRHGTLESCDVIYKLAQGELSVSRALDVNAF